ncbi:MAG TPA: hydrolase [Candidatus Hydrogenedentes bacterium]|nr:hydrolase [Candidatus Hydrogenedentota bacterium]
MLDRDSATLVVIDFQEKLLPKIHDADAIGSQAIKLIRFARELGMPILWTEQYPKGLGHTVEPIAAELGGETPIEKTVFGCIAAPGFASALAASGRKQLLLTGIEAHICVMQTALAALDEGYEVFIPKDAVGSRTPAEYDAGLERLQRAGAEIVTTEMAMFELLREAGTPEFKKTLPLFK